MGTRITKCPGAILDPLLRVCDLPAGHAERGQPWCVDIRGQRFTRNEHDEQKEAQKRTNQIVIQSHKIAAQQARLARLDERIGHLMSQRAIGEEKLAQLLLQMKEL